MITVDDPFRAAFVAHPLPMWFYDAATSAIIDVNDAALTHYGLSREEFLRHGPAQPTADESNDIELVSHRFDFNGRPAVFVTVRDVSAQRSVERALASAEQEQRRLTSELEERVRLRTVQLQAAASELEAFSYSVSHDLRAPLRSIAGFSQALIEDAGPALPPDAQDDIARIVAAAKRMDHLINDLLELSMFSRSEMTRQSVDISDLARKIAGELADVSPTREVSVRIAPGMEAQGDPPLVRVALENLITNAWKFTSRRERACIEVGQVSEPAAPAGASETPATGEGAATVFYVRDNGVGFDLAYADKLFGPFQRLHDATQFPGTGIGLATVRRIVLRHGGRIWAESRPGEGACFYFTLQ